MRHVDLPKSFDLAGGPTFNRKKRSFHTASVGYGRLRRSQFGQFLPFARAMQRSFDGLLHSGSRPRLDARMLVLSTFEYRG
jgi:hypothetical protein